MPTKYKKRSWLIGVSTIGCRVGLSREYFEAHPNDSDFNCKDFYLNEELLNKLEEDIKKDSLPKTEGFFYGDDSYSWEERDEMKQYDLQFVANARKAIKEGYDIVYSCWW
jgi:hypothetical protein